MDFGIESTTLGNQDLLDDILGGQAAVADPKDVTPIDEAAEAAKKAAADKAKADADKQKEEPDFIDTLLGGNPKDDDDNDNDPDDKEGDKDKKTDNGQSNVEAPFEKLSKDFFELQLFTLAEGEAEPEIKTPEQFIERVELEKKKGAVQILENYIGRFGEDYQDAFDAIFNKGVNPKEYFTTFNKITDYASLDITKESNQERIVRESLMEQGYEAEDIDSKIQKFKDYSDLEDEAKRAQKLLVKRESLRLEETTREAELKLVQAAQEKQKYVTNVNTVLSEKLKAKEFDGIPLNPELAKEVSDSLINEKWQLPDGTKLTDFDKDILDLKNPENHALKVKVALLLKVLKKDPTLSTIQKKGVTTKSKELFSHTVGKDDVNKQTSNKKSSGTGWF